MRKLLLTLGALSYVSVGHAGGGMSKVLVGVGAGLVTGGAAYLATGFTSAAVTTGVTTAASVATGGRVPARVGVTVNANGDLRSVDVGAGRRANGDPIVQASFESRERRDRREQERMQNFRPSYYDSSEEYSYYDSSEDDFSYDASSDASEYEFYIEKKDPEHRTFSFGTSYSSRDWNITEQYYDERKYDRAKSTTSTSEVMSKVGRKWKIGEKRSFDSYSTFEPQSFAEAMAMKSFKFEETTLQWHFGIEYLNGQTYHRAWEDGGRDLMVPAGSVWYVGAGSHKPKRDTFSSMMHSMRPMTSKSNFEDQFQTTKNFYRKSDFSRMYDENKSCRDLLDLNFEMFKQGEDISVPSYSEPIRKNVSKKEWRRSKDITSHVRAIDSKSGWTSAKGLMANATLFRYKTETFVENNPGLYNSLMFMADAYNTAALSKDIAIALGSAAMGNPAVACGFLAKYALFAGVEQLALWVCEHGAENLALYCAEGDAAIYASYLKTLDFVVDFAVKHGVCGALNKKLATANGYSARQFNLNKPHEFRSGKTSGGAEYRKVKPARRVSTMDDLNSYMNDMIGVNSGALLNCGKTMDGYHYYKVNKKFTYRGITFKKGDYLSKDTQHYEIEWFRGKDTHLGAINVLSGKLTPDTADPKRILRAKN